VSARVPLFYTFGNHMHWVDMEWLWGYHVLPGSVRDMLHFCRETGARGNVNFDGIGYEKLASEDPEAFAELREAVRAGTVELVGCSYGQPYGLFHGGESNARQRIYGARAAVRLFGVRPRTFWEEEFDFFPQLPQLLKGVGYEYASLFFQWTWHTPEVPKEEDTAIWWEGQDGTRLLCATRNRLNLHQWPEDVDILLGDLAKETTPDPSRPTPLILQWLELMPSPDWMCRSEVLLPKTKELLSDPRFDIRFGTLSEYLESVRGSQLQSRRYTMDEVWHGMSLGKNADNMRRLSRDAEASLLTAETLAAVAGLFGRPYAQWDVYPTWELEESWRELLQAQHHDNDECEGLCGHIGRFSYERSLSLSDRIIGSTATTLARHLGGDAFVFRNAPHKPKYVTSVHGSIEEPAELERVLLFNPLGWRRRVPLEGGRSPVEVPGFGFVLAAAPQISGWTPPDFGAGEQSAGGIKVTQDSPSGRLLQIVTPQFPEGALAAPNELTLVRGGQRHSVSRVGPSDRETTADLRVWIEESRPAVWVSRRGSISRPDPGMNAGLQTGFKPAFRAKIVADQPYGVSELQPNGVGLKKYPTGDWMTSPQWFEEVQRPFTATSFVDLVDTDNPDRGLLIVHDGSQQWFLDEDGTARCLVNMADPWDESYFQGQFEVNFYLVPHGPITHADRMRIAQELLRPPVSAGFSGTPNVERFDPVECTTPNVLLTAFYRETRDSGRGIEGYAANDFAVDYPYVLRLAEFDGVESEAVIRFAPTVAQAAKTDLLGARAADLEVIGEHEIRVPMRPFEIATVYLDLVEGRKQVRDLDAHRNVWATVHRVEE